MPPAGRTRTLDPKALLDVLARHSVDFVVIGGFSLAAHGYVRATKDLDIVPAPSPSNLGRLAAALRQLDGVLYAGYDELISMKVASGREEDLRDVGALEAARREG